MARLIVSNQCWICGNSVDIVPDNILRKEPHAHNVEFVVTHLGRKQYFHSKCWYGMIESQKKRERLYD